MTSTQIAMCVGIAISILFIYFMNVKGTEYIEDNSIPMMSFVDASEWLSKNLNSTDLVLVPHYTVFYSLNPSLKDQFKDYKVVWEKAGVIWRANTTSYEVSKVRQYLGAIITYEPRLKYLVIDWFYPYSDKIFTNRSCSDFESLLHEVKRFDFKPPHMDWEGKLTICGINGRA